MFRVGISSRFPLIIGVLVLLAFGVLPVMARDTGRDVGAVTDPSGSVVPKAQVTVTNTVDPVSAQKLENNQALKIGLKLSVEVSATDVEMVTARDTQGRL
jgi:hypothetical protein